MKPCKEMSYPTRQRADKARIRRNEAMTDGKPYVGSVFCQKCQGFHLSTAWHSKSLCRKRKYDTRESALGDIDARNEAIHPASGREDYTTAYLCRYCDYYHVG